MAYSPSPPSASPASSSVAALPVSPLNLFSYIETARPSLRPPVGNKLIWGAGQHKVMIVGGPNVRKDYHLQAGEVCRIRMQAAPAGLIKGKEESDFWQASRPVSSAPSNSTCPNDALLDGWHDALRYSLQEIFYQVEGDMVLKIIEAGEHKDVPIPQGHILFLPRGIPHSPQVGARIVLLG